MSQIPITIAPKSDFRGKIVAENIKYYKNNTNNRYHE